MSANALYISELARELSWIAKKDGLLNVALLLIVVSEFAAKSLLDADDEDVHARKRRVS